MLVQDINQAVILLNNLLKHSPVELSQFFNTSVLIDKTSADTLFEVGPSPYRTSVNLFPIGLINGFVSETDESGRVVKRIAAKYKDDTPVIDHFYVDDIRDHKNDDTKT